MCVFLRRQGWTTMGDEDWEAEIITPHLSSYVPVFEKVALRRLTLRGGPGRRCRGRAGGRGAGGRGTRVQLPAPLLRPPRPVLEETVRTVKHALALGAAPCS